MIVRCKMGTIKYFLTSLISMILFVKILNATPVPSDQENGSGPKIVIVGAGVSGLGAANRLLKKGIKDVTVLEAMDRIGGRVNYVDIGEGLGGVDLGAHWIHGQEGNIVYELGNSLGIVGSSGDYEKQVLVRPGGKIIDLGKPFLDVFDHLVEGVGKLSDEEKKLDFEQYMHKRVDKLIKPLGMSPEEAKAMKYYVSQSMCTLEACNDLRDVSIHQPTDYEEREGDKLVEWKTRGMGTIVELLNGTHNLSPWKDLDLMSHVKLSSRVSKIDWSGEKVTIATESGDKYTADYVIITPSINVLKKKHEQIFTPSLPMDKIHVIESLGMDVVDKIFLVFEKPWWPKNVTGFALLHDHIYPSTTQDWGYDIITFDAENGNPHVLNGWMIGDGARAMEQASEEEVKITSMRILREFIGNSYDIPEPVKVVRTRWWNEEDVIGSYSFNHRNSDHIREPRNILAKPVFNSHGKPVLLFAGEATNDEHYATVHGALESGFREADRILALIN